MEQRHIETLKVMARGIRANTREHAAIMAALDEHADKAPTKAKKGKHDEEE